MKIIIEDTNEELSRRIAEDLIQLTEKKDHPVLCTASGDSPSGLYKELVQRIRQNKLDVSGWNFVGLDEWIGMNGEDEGSCRYHLDQQFFRPACVDFEKISFFDGRREDMIAECARIEKFIQQHNGIDIAIIGLGLNGHVGMNEPGTDPGLYAHITELDEQTKEVAQKYFSQKVEITGGVTLGIADLKKARHVFLIVNGRHKAEIVQKILGAPVSKQLPASLLREHPGLHIYLDKEAASMIRTEKQIV